MKIHSAHCHVCLPTPYLLSSWHPIVLSSRLFHSRIVSAPRTLFEHLLTMSLSHWHWPRLWDHPTLRDLRDCMHVAVLPCSDTEWFTCLIRYHISLYILCAMTLAFVLQMKPMLTTEFPRLPPSLPCTLKIEVSKIWPFVEKAKLLNFYVMRWLRFILSTVSRL